MIDEKKLGTEKVGIILMLTESLVNLAAVAQKEGGFSPGLLGCFRARSVDLTSEVLKLTPVKPVPAPEPAPEKPVQSRRINPRGSPRPFVRVTQKVCDQVLDLCVQGKENIEIEELTGVNAGMCQRLRRRSQWASNHWGKIDSWMKRNPNADLRVIKYVEAK
jgi:hypothetical protein